jgi:hypothetical protein
MLGACHSEERSDEAIQSSRSELDYFALLAMTGSGRSPTFSRRIRRPHAAGYLDAPVAFDHGDVELALQVEPELRAIAEIATEANSRIGRD